METSMRDTGYSKEEEYFRRVNREVVAKHKMAEREAMEMAEVTARAAVPSTTESSPSKRDRPWWDELIAMFSLSRRN